MNSTAELRLPFAVRPLTPNLGAEILGVEPGGGHLRRTLPTRSTRRSCAIRCCCSRRRTCRPAPGRVRAAFRRGADPRDEPVSRRWLSGAVSALEPRRERQAQRQASGQGNARLAHRRLVVARDRPGDDHLRRSRARTSAARRISATCTARTSASIPRGRRASPTCAPCTTSISRARAAMARTR